MRKIKVFILDTNILISNFLLSSNSVTARAYDKAKINGKIVMSKATYDEFSDVFIRPKFDKYLPLAVRLTILEDIKKFIKFIRVSKFIKACRDPKDDKYLELAIAANADYIVTGDKDLLVLHPFKHIPIITPADFVELHF